MANVQYYHEPPARIQRRRDIGKLGSRVDATNKLQYDEESLNEIHIRSCPMTLDQSHEPTFQPCFFKPYKDDLNTEPVGWESIAQWEWKPYKDDNSRTSWMSANVIHHYFTIYFAAQSCDSRNNPKLPFNHMLDPTCFGTQPLCESIGTNTTRWIAHGCAFLDDRYPHLMVEMISNAHGENDKITRGELLCILRTMEKLMKFVRLVKHMFTPVLVICYMASQRARVLQAFYDGVELVIHKTELLNFGNGRNFDTLLLLTRWTASTAVGRTRPARAKAR